ncbi:hypothetical protein F5887DRAFT_1075871 [Amanita rubescens]|nr:hypothetical protein F5887DRAFT_1075871 [Amanita rubescens]
MKTGAGTDRGFWIHSLQLVRSPQWSADLATSEIVFASRTPSIGFGEEDISSMGALWTDFTSSKGTWGCELSTLPSPIHKSTYGCSPDVDFHLDDGLVSDTSREPYVHVELVLSPSESHLEDGFGVKKPELMLDMHLDAWSQITPITNSYLSSASISTSTESSDTVETAREYGDYTSSIYFLADSSTFHSAYIYRKLKIRRPIMASPSRGDNIWRTNSLTRISISSPSRYSVPSASVSPIRTKWSDSDSDDEAQRRRISYLDSRIASDWSITFGAASVKAEGIKSPYYTFRRSNAPSPEESAVRVTQEGEAVGVPG